MFPVRAVPFYLPERKRRMPLPKPQPDEEKDDFIIRCMGDDTMVEEYPEEDQRRAVCETQWEEKDKAMRKFEIKAAKGKEKTAEIWIYDDIGEFWFGGGITAKSFADALKDFGDVDVLNIYINSAGGLVADGLAIYNTLKRHQARKEVFIDGFALSIASLVAMAGDKISIAANGMMMIHPPWGFVEGGAVEMRKSADVLDKLEESLVDTYARRTGQSETEIAVLVKNETWMDAEDALLLGFADEITEEVKLAAYFDPAKRFKNAPKSPQKAIKPEPPAPKEPTTVQPESCDSRIKYKAEAIKFRILNDRRRKK